MGDDVGSEAQRYEALRLIRTFLGISDPDKRQRILRLAEQLVDDAAAEAVNSGLPEAAREASGEIAGRTE